MRVLMICPELPSDGRPGSMAPAARQFESLRTLGVELDVHDMRGLPLVKYLLALPRIRKLARQVDVIHAHFGYCGWLAYLATRLMRKRPPIVMSFMGDDLLGTPYNEGGDQEWFSRVMVRCNQWLAQRLNKVIVKSREMAGVIADAHCTVVPNGVDVSRFSPVEQAAAREQLGLDSQVVYILFPGDANNPRKGFALASEAVQLAAEQLGHSIEILKLWGVRPDEVPLYMSACDVMTMTSLIEGSPNVVKEALAVDMAIVSVPVGDVHEILEGIEGCFCVSRNAHELAEAIVQAVGTSESNGREALLRKRLDLESVALQIINIYRHAIENGDQEDGLARTARSSDDAVQSANHATAFRSDDSNSLNAQTESMSKESAEAN
ncbi:MAG: glycosyltransferase [Pirellulaceae bacterium]